VPILINVVPLFHS